MHRQNASKSSPANQMLFSGLVGHAWVMYFAYTGRHSGAVCRTSAIVCDGICCWVFNKSNHLDKLYKPFKEIPRRRTASQRHCTAITDENEPTARCSRAKLICARHVPGDAVSTFLQYCGMCMPPHCFRGSVFTLEHSCLTWRKRTIALRASLFHKT